MQIDSCVITYCFGESYGQVHCSMFDFCFPRLLDYALWYPTFHNVHLKEMVLSEFPDYQLFHNDLGSHYLAWSFQFVESLHKGCSWYRMVNCSHSSAKFLLGVNEVHAWE